MSTKRVKKISNLTLEEKYERWKAFAVACHANRFHIVSALREPAQMRKKKAVKAD
jgi:hypothetical protein